MATTPQKPSIIKTSELLRQAQEEYRKEQEQEVQASAEKAVRTAPPPKAELEESMLGKIGGLFPASNVPMARTVAAKPPEPSRGELGFLNERVNEILGSGVYLQSDLKRAQGALEQALAAENERRKKANQPLLEAVRDDSPFRTRMVLREKPTVQPPPEEAPEVLTPEQAEEQAAFEKQMDETFGVSPKRKEYLERLGRGATLPEFPGGASETERPRPTQPGAAQPPKPPEEPQFDEKRVKLERARLFGREVEQRVDQLLRDYKPPKEQKLPRMVSTPYGSVVLPDAATAETDNELKLLGRAKQVLARVRNMNPEKTGFIPGLQRAVQEPAALLPFLGALTKIGELTDVLLVARKRERGGKLTDGESALLDAYGAYLSAAENFSPGILDKAAEIAVNIPQFALEFAATSGLYRAGKKVTLEAIRGWLKDVAKGEISRKAKGVAARAVASAAGAVVQTAAQPAAITVETLRRMIPRMEVLESPEGEKTIAMLDGKGGGEAFLRALGATFGEIASERTGLAVPWLKKALLGRWLQNRGATGLSPELAKFAQRAGWNGILGEIFEEQVNKPWQNILDEYGPFERGFTKEDFATEALAFTLFGSAAKGLGFGTTAAGKALRKRRLEKELPTVEKQPPPAPATEISPAVVERPEDIQGKARTEAIKEGVGKQLAALRADKDELLRRGFTEEEVSLMSPREVEAALAGKISTERAAPGKASQPKAPGTPQPAPPISPAAETAGLTTTPAAPQTRKPAEAAPPPTPESPAKPVLPEELRTPLRNRERELRNKITAIELQMLDERNKPDPDLEKLQALRDEVRPLEDERKSIIAQLVEEEKKLEEKAASAPKPAASQAEQTTVRVPFVTSERSAKKAVRATDELLVRRAIEKAEATGDEFNQDRYEQMGATLGRDKKLNLTPAERNDLNMYLFGTLEGGTVEELEAGIPEKKEQEPSAREAEKPTEEPQAQAVPEFVPKVPPSEVHFGINDVVYAVTPRPELRINARDPLVVTGIVGSGGRDTVQYKVRAKNGKTYQTNGYGVAATPKWDVAGARFKDHPNQPDEARYILGDISARDESVPKPEKTQEESARAQAYELGVKAFRSGIKRAPALDKEFGPLLDRYKDSALRQTLMKDWTRGWDEENLKPLEEDEQPTRVPMAAATSEAITPTTDLSTIAQFVSRKTPPRPVRGSFYHATDGEYVRFGRAGAFFSQEEKRDFGPQIIKAELNIKRALIALNEGEAALTLGLPELADEIETINTTNKSNRAIMENSELRSRIEKADAAVAEAARKQGFDGIVYVAYRGGHIVALEKDAISGAPIKESTGFTGYIPPVNVDAEYQAAIQMPSAPSDRWTPDPGAIPGEAMFYLDVKDEDLDTARGSITELDEEPPMYVGEIDGVEITRSTNLKTVAKETEEYADAHPEREEVQPQKTRVPFVAEKPDVQQPQFTEGQRVTWTNAKGTESSGTVVKMQGDNVRVKVGQRGPMPLIVTVKASKLRAVEGTAEVPLTKAEAAPTLGVETEAADVTAAARPTDREGTQPDTSVTEPIGERPAPLEGQPAETVRRTPSEREIEGSGEAERAGSEVPSGGSGGARPELRPGVGVRVEGEDVSPARTPRDRGVKPSDAPAGNFYHITAEDRIGEGGLKQKYRDNVAAIKLLKKLEAEGRLATPEEQAVLVKYVGWGGLSTVFDQWSYDKQWAKEREEIQEVLTIEELEEARSSSQFAHYTSMEVIEEMWAALQRMGFEGGRVLEPSVGIGHFLGGAPVETAANSRFVGIDIDSISARITRQLYQTAKVFHSPFEKVTLPNGFFDLVISNVPFSETKPADPKYDKHRLSLHNYFIVRGLDLLRPGGLMAVITTHSTMDTTKYKNARELMGERADLIAAARLPQTAFQQIANTAVVTDILIFRKRAQGEQPVGIPFIEAKIASIERDGTIRAVGAGEGGDTHINEAFLSKPELILGRNSMEGSMYRGGEYTVLPNKQTPLREQIAKALEVPRDLYDRAPVPESQTQEAVVSAERQAELKLKPFAFHIEDGKLFQNKPQNLDAPRNEWTFSLEPIEAEPTEIRRITGLFGVRDAARKLMLAEYNDQPDAEISKLRKELNKVYDKFVAAYRNINHRSNYLIAEDPDFPLLQALEVFDAEAETWKKAPVFSKRTVRPKAIPKPETPRDALLLSLSERNGIDIPYMANSIGQTEQTVINALVDQDLIFKNPEGGWEERGAYLSGNVRAKLKVAQGAASVDPSFERNVKALEAVQPRNKGPADISIRLGTPWIPASDIEQFMAETFALWNQVEVTYTPSVGQWDVKVRGSKDNAKNSNEWGTEHFYGHELAKMALNLKEPVKRFKDPSGKSYVDVEATEKAKDQQIKIQERFQQWVWENPERTKRLTDYYNENVNNIAQRSWKGTGAHLTIPSLAFGVSVRERQKDGIWRGLQSRNVLYAWEVGSGKTLLLGGLAMEARRLGKYRKPAIVAHNATVEQYRQFFAQYFPQANVLIPTKEDFEAGNRRRLVSRIATGDWDVIVIPHSQFTLLPVSEKALQAFMDEELANLRAYLEQIAAEEGESYGRGRRRKSMTVKRIEKMLDAFQARMEKKIKEYKKDPTLSFEETGIDALFVDEADEFKNLMYLSKMDRVKGLGNKEGSDRAFDMLVKTRLVNAMNNGGGIVFATGTPVSNTMAEIYALMRYLAPEKLRELGIEHFDSWAQQFGDIKTDWETSPTAPTNIQATRRFARIRNTEELYKHFSEFTDIIFSKDIPEIKLPKNRVEVKALDTYPNLESYTRVLIQRAKKVKSGEVDPTEDNMLVITNDGRYSSIDLRFVDENAEDDPRSKLNQAIFDIHEEYKKSNPVKGVQLVALDLGVPGAKKKEEGASRFAAYQHIKNKLVELGVPKDEIAWVHQFKSEEQKKRMLRDVNEGKIRILIGSTAKMGVGLNVQQRLVGGHHIDIGWRPRDATQREGRWVRQGNTNPEVFTKYWTTKQTLDSYLYSTLEAKRGFIEQFLRGEINAPEVDDISSEAVTFGVISAAVTGKKEIVELAKTQAEIRKLERLRSASQRELFNTKAELEHAKARLQAIEPTIQRLKEEAEAIQARYDPDSFSIVVEGKRYTERPEAGEVLVRAVAELRRKKVQGQVVLGEYLGLPIEFSGVEILDVTGHGKNLYFGTVMVGKRTASVQESGAGAIQSIVYTAVKEPQAELERERAERDRLKEQIPQLEKLAERGFPQEKVEQLAKLEAREKELLTALGLLRSDVQAEGAEEEKGRRFVVAPEEEEEEGEVDLKSESETFPMPRKSRRKAEARRLEGESDLRALVIEYLDLLAENDLVGEDFEFVDAYLTGSEARGEAKKTSDIDVVVLYRGEIREDDLFNAANDPGQFVEGMERLTHRGRDVDINPVKEDRRGELEDAGLFPTKEEEASQIVENAVKLFGTTEDLKTAKYILPDGRMLAGPEDHADIAVVLGPDYVEAAESELDIGTREFVKQTGAVRIGFERPFAKDGSYVHIGEVPPTEAQMRRIRQLVGASRGYWFTIETEGRGSFEKLSPSISEVVDFLNRVITDRGRAGEPEAEAKSKEPVAKGRPALEVPLKVQGKVGPFYRLDTMDRGIIQALHGKRVADAVAEGQPVVVFRAGKPGEKLKDGTWLTAKKSVALAYQGPFTEGQFGGSELYRYEIPAEDLVSVDNLDQSELIYKPSKESEKPETMPAQAVPPTPPTPAVPMARVSGEPVRRRDVLKEIKDLLEVPFAKGRFRERALGIFKRVPFAIRTKFADVVDVDAHELGHAIHKYLWGLTSKNQLETKALRPYSKELKSIVPPNWPKSKRTMVEGYAEFMRLFITNPQQAEAQAPTFYQFFTGLLRQPANTPLADALRAAQKKWQTYKAQPPVQKVASDILFDESDKPGRTLREFLGDLITAYFDEIRPIAKGTEAIFGVKRVEQVPTESNPYVLLEALKNNQLKGRLLHFMKYGPLKFDGSQADGKALFDILKPVDTNEKWQDFGVYLVAKTAVERLTKKPGMVLPQDQATYEAAVRELEEKYEWFPETAQELYEWGEAGLQYFADSGKADPETIEKIREFHTEHVPLYRDVDSLEKATFQGLGNRPMRVPNPLKRAKGGTNLILNPIVSKILNVATLVNAADRWDVQKAVVALAEQPDSAWLIEKVDPKKHPVKFNLNEISRLVSDMTGLDLSENDLDALAMLWRDEDSRALPDNIIEVRRGKERTLYEIKDPEFVKALRSVRDSAQADLLTNVLVGMARLLRTGVVLPTDFAIRNALRDQGTAAIMANRRYIPFFDFARAIAHIIKKDETYRMAVAAGLRHYALDSLNRQTLAEFLRDELRKKRSGQGYSIIVRHPLEAMQYLWQRTLASIEELSQTIELASRLPEFERGRREAIERGEGPRYASIRGAYEAGRVTVNFSKMGSSEVMKWLAATAAFFNPNLQGLKRIAEGHWQHPKRTILRGIAWLTIPSILLYMLNRDDEEYMDMPLWRRMLFWHIPVWRLRGKKTDGVNYIMLPKPFELGLLYATVPELVVAHYDQRERVDIGKFWRTAAESYLPTPIPTAFLTILHQYGNVDAFGRPIESDYEKDLRPEYRFRPNTPSIWRRVGKTLGLSPRRAQQAWRDSTGTLGGYIEDLASIVDDLASDRKDVRPRRRLAETPFVRSFVARPPGFDAEPIQTFYDRLETLERDYATARLPMKGREVEPALVTENLRVSGKGKIVPAEELTAMRKANELLRGLRKQLLAVQQSTTMTKEEKRQAISALEQAAIRVARNALRGGVKTEPFRVPFVPRRVEARPGR